MGRAMTYKQAPIAAGVLACGVSPEAATGQDSPSLSSAISPATDGRPAPTAAYVEWVNGWRYFRWSC
jgi:hypothetical protein